MSSRRSGQSSGSSRISDDQIMDLVTKLQELLPDDILHESTNAKVSASEERQKKDLSERLSQLLATIDSDTPQASIIRSLLATIDFDTPQASTARSSTIDSDTPQASKVLDETCECARKLQGEVEDLSERLSQLLATLKSDTPQASIVRSLINQDWP